jgi:hypothetical membrane protein
MVLASLAATYTLFVVEGAAFLPMLSGTFVPIPGNYISRIVLSLTGLALYPLAAIPYYSPAQPYECISRKLIAGMAMIGATCLAVVGAVCESDNELTCMGNSDVHTASAITFFACYDMYMITLTLHGHFSSAGWATRTAVHGAIALSLASKVRFIDTGALVGSLLVHQDKHFEHSPPGFGDNLLAIFEYLDTGAIAVWVVAAMQHNGASISFGFAPDTTPMGAVPSSSSVQYALPVQTMALATAGFGLVTLAFTFGIACAQGTIEPRVSWPYISDLWVHQPSNMISRFAICLTGAMIGVSQLGHYAAVSLPRAGRPRLTKLAHAFSVLAGVGLIGVGMCNKQETPSVHFGSAAVFFGSLALWMPLDLATSVGHWIGPSRAAAVIAASVCIGAKLGQGWCHLKHGAAAHPIGSHGVTEIGVFSDMSPEGLEWSAALAGTCYFVLTHVAAPAASFLVYSDAANKGELLPQIDASAMRAKPKKVDVRV